MHHFLSEAEAAERLLFGDVVAYPTETLYGLAVNPDNQAALRRLVELKGRDEGKPVGLILGSASDIPRVSRFFDNRLFSLCDAFWPGPLTIVLPACDNLDPIITGGSDTVAVRVPGLSSARRLASLAGGAITATSANHQGETPPSTALGVSTLFRRELSDNRIAGIYDGRTAPGGPPSTIVQLVNNTLHILRDGAVSSAQIAETWDGAVICRK